VMEEVLETETIAAVAMMAMICTTEEMSNSTRKMKTNYSSERCWVTTFLLEHIQLSIFIVNTLC
jgi:hypothetical protein